MKSLFSFTLVFALVLSFAACGGGSDDGDVSTAGDFIEESDDAGASTAGDYAEGSDDPNVSTAGDYVEGAQTYYCEEGTAFTVTYDTEADPQTASIEMAGETTDLESVESASGAKYSDGDMVAWFQGETEALFASEGGDDAELITCARH